MTAQSTPGGSRYSRTADLVVTGIGSVTPPPGESPADWFDYRRELGPRGYKYLPRASHYLLASAKRALADAGVPVDGVPVDGVPVDGVPIDGETGRGCGVAIGSNNSMSQLHADLDRAVLTGGMKALRPALAPYFSVNLALARLAMEHALKGFNLALHTPVVAGLEAIQTGARAVMLGRASWLLVGATEERLDSEQPGAADSEEGSVVLVLEPATTAAARGVQGYGRCVARTAFLPPRLATGEAGSTRATELLAAAFAELGATTPPTVRVSAEDSAVAGAVLAALGPSATWVETGAGCLGPVLDVATSLTAGQESVTVAVAATGNIAVTRVVPHAVDPSR